MANNKIDLQVLVSTMFQSDYSLLDKMGIESDAIIVNQCDSNSIREIEYKGYSVIWIDSYERGLSRSRNLALENSKADICLLCDDDETLYTNYRNIILEAYKNLNDADLIVFNINRIGYKLKNKNFTKKKKVSKIKHYSSVHISFRRAAILKKRISFNVDFGAGSGKYSCSEDSLFFRECHNAKLVMYTYPNTIGEVNCESSSWFTGYNEKYFYDMGAFVAAAFPKTKHIIKWYYPFRFRRLTPFSTQKTVGYINMGIDGYSRNVSYDEYIKR